MDYAYASCNGKNHVTVVVETVAPITYETAMKAGEEVALPMMNSGQWPGENWPKECEVCRGRA